jgi:hypothetical protein
LVFHSSNYPGFSKLKYKIIFMARTAITLARTHKGKWIMASGPDKPITEQLKVFRTLQGQKFHPEFNLVRYQENDGLARDITLRTPDAHKAHTALREKEQIEAERAGDAEVANRAKNAKQLDQDRADRHAAEIAALEKLIPTKSKKAPHSAASETEEGSKESAKVTLLLDGPSFEAWVENGMTPGAYPPAGYAERDTPGLALYKANLENKDFNLKPALKALAEKLAAEEAGKTAAEQNQENKKEAQTETA